MKAITILLLSLICSNLLGQEIVDKEIKTEVNWIFRPIVYHHSAA